MVKFVEKLMKIVEILLTACLSVSVFVVILQVFFRYVLKDPIGWSEQISRMLFIWMVMLGIPVLFNRNNVMQFDLISTSLPVKVQHFLHILFNAIGIAFFAFYLRYAVQICVEMLGRFTSGVPIPFWALYGPQAVCATLTIFVLIKRLILEVQKIKGGN